MKIYSWNVNGIRAVDKKGMLRVFIDQEAPDIICLQETKASEDQLSLDFPNYYKYWNSADKKGYSGTAIWTKSKPLQIINDLPHDIAAQYDLENDHYGDPSTEGRVIVAEFDTYYVVSVYTPNAKADLSRLELRHQRWDPAFLAYMKRLEASKPVIFSGDLNVARTELDLANPAANIGKHGFTTEEREGIEALIRSGFVDTFRIFNHDGGHYTWWTHWAKSRERNIGWRIDYCMVSESLSSSIVSAGIHASVMGSDHCPVSIEIMI